MTAFSAIFITRAANLYSDLKGYFYFMKVVIIAVLLMLSAICSATETAFSSCNRIRLKKLADDGNKSAKKAMNICDNFDKALTAILVGNNVVNISSSSLAKTPVET